METDLALELTVGLAVGSRLRNGAWCLAARPSPHAFALKAEGKDVQYTYVCLTFHSGAGAEAPFAVGRFDAGGRVNPVTYDYYATLTRALAEYWEVS